MGDDFFMFCVEEHKWDYFTRIYRCAYSTRIYIGVLATRPHFFFGGGNASSPAGKGTLSAGEGTLSTGEDALPAHLYILFRKSDRFLCPSCSIQENRYG